MAGVKISKMRLPHCAGYFPEDIVVSRLGAILFLESFVLGLHSICPELLI